MLRATLFCKGGRNFARLNTGTCLLAVLCVVGLAALPAAANLLSNPGFEGGPNSLYPGGINLLIATGSPSPDIYGYEDNIWGVENGAVISSSTAAIGTPPPSPQVINPNSGSYMLDMAGSGFVYTHAYQFVPIPAPYVGASGVTLNLSAFFNAPNFTAPGGGPAQPIASLDVQFYTAAYLSINNSSLNNGSPGVGQLNDVGVPPTIGGGVVIPTDTWTQLSLTGIPVPTDAIYILAQVAFNNASMTDENGYDYDGYVDDANLTLVVPEPASVGLIFVSAMGMLGMRRRKSA